MSNNDIIQFLRNLGLSRRETDVYLFLAKSGVSSTSFVAKRLKIERVQAYRIFKKMQEKGFIETTLEKPTRFTAVPFEELLQSYINTKKTEVQKLVDQQESLTSSWRASSAPESEQMIAKFSVITGKKKIHARMLNMIQESKKGILVLTTSTGLVQEDVAGIFDEILRTAPKRNIEFKIITDVSRENLKIAETITKKIAAKTLNVECRHVDLSSKFFPCFLIKDDEEAILYGSFSSGSSLLDLEDNGLWIYDKMFVSILKGFFIQMWQKAVTAESSIQALKTGIPLGETFVIRDPDEAKTKMEEILGTAKKDIIAITSSEGINKIQENDPFIKYRKQDLTIRIMSSIDLDNLETAKKLAGNYQVKHVPINYLAMVIVDNKTLFMFKSPPLKGSPSQTPFYLDDTFYTNDSLTVERAGEMLNDIWKRGVEISEIDSQAGIKLPAVSIGSEEKASELIDTMIQNNVDAVLVTENHKTIGIVTQRDLLKEMAKSKIDPRNTLIRDLNYTPLVEMENVESLSETMRSMHKEGLNRVALVKDGQLVGMLTENLGKNKQTA